MIYNRPRRAKKKVKITLSGYVFDEYSAFVKIEGKSYSESTTIEVAPGTEFTVYAGSGFKKAYTNSQIFLNGSAYGQYGIGSSGNAYYKYGTFTATENVSISFSSAYASGRLYCNAYITMPA